MIRLNILVEGQTEEAFVKNVLAEYLAMKNIFATPRIVQTGHDLKHGVVFRGGMTSYSRVRNDLGRWMKEDPKADAFSTMFDLYRLPKDFPGLNEAVKISNPIERVMKVEAEFGADLKSIKFIPYVQLHEHEALLLSDPQKFDVIYAECRVQIDELSELVNRNVSPEHIDMGDETCPSKQIIKRIPKYGKEKVFAAPLIAKHIGIETMKVKCRHFAEWLRKIESLTE